MVEVDIDVSRDAKDPSCLPQTYSCMFSVHKVRTNRCSVNSKTTTDVSEQVHSAATGLEGWETSECNCNI